MHNQDERCMHNNEENEGNETQKVKTARRLAPSKKLDIPGKTRFDRRRHSSSRQEHEWRKQKNDTRVGQLLQRIKGSEVARWWYMKGQVGQSCGPGTWNERP